MEKLKSLYEEWEHFLSPLFFTGGFLLDIFTLGRVDDLSNIFIFLFYLIICMIIFLMDLEVIIVQTEGKSDKSPTVLFYEYRDEIFHFAQGALLSAFTLFYFKSASLSASLIFMAFMTSLLFINEFSLIQKLGAMVKGLFLNLTLLSFALVYVPLSLGEVGILIFALSILAFTLVTSAIAWFLYKRNVSLKKIKLNWLTPAGIFLIGFILCRAVGLMPPVPLSLETAGIYHKVEKDYPQYHLYHQKEWWRFWNSSDEYFRATPDDKIYFFTRVFAPGGFKDKIFVHWQIYQNGEWQTSDKIPLTITGGREEGFRGYTYKTNYREGEWRVLVETKGGLEIGRLNFEVENITPEQASELKMKKKSDG